MAHGRQRVFEAGVVIQTGRGLYGWGGRVDGGISWTQGEHKRRFIACHYYFQTAKHRREKNDDDNGTSLLR